MPDPTLSNLGAQIGTYIRANRGGALRSPDQGDSFPGIQRLGIITSNAGETFYLYYNPATNVIAYSSTTPEDTGRTG